MHERPLRARTRRVLPGLALALALAGAASSGPTPATADGPSLTADEVRRVVAQAASEARGAGLSAWIAVTDAEGNVLGLFRMAGATGESLVPEDNRVPDVPRRTAPSCGRQGLEGLALPAHLVAITKAGTGAFLSSGGNAFSTRTASFIVQSNFPPGVDLTPAGPLFGVQFSSVICTDFKRPSLPLGLSGDPGGVPLYKDGRVAGGVGVEGDGSYGADLDPATSADPDDAIAEERAALAGARGFEPPELIRADRILADGIRLPYADVDTQGSGAVLPAGEFVALPAFGLGLAGTQAGRPSAFQPATAGGVAGRGDPRFPVRSGSVLTAADVGTILGQAARQTTLTRAAIRQPLNSAARVSIAVVDLDGSVLGFFQNDDAPNFGIDVSVQKARTANFFSGPGAADDLRRAGLGAFLRDGLALDGSVAFTSRAVGFLAQPFFPPGIPGTEPGPLSTGAPPFWSPFNTGLQLELLCGALEDALVRGVVPSRCSAAIPRLPNGITVFPGGVPLFKGGRLAGAVGISGDGVDQDDLISAAGAAGFDAPNERRCDQLVIRGVRLPYVKFPRHPDL